MCVKETNEMADAGASIFEVACVRIFEIVKEIYYASKRHLLKEI